MPLIDVVFLLLTFFVYAMVLMVRAELLPVEMPALAAGEPARPAPAVTISIDHAGKLFFNREPVALEEVLPRIEAAKAEDAATVVYVAAEAQGQVDRLPMFLRLYDRLAYAGLDIKLVGQPKGEKGADARTEAAVTDGPD